MRLHHVTFMKVGAELRGNHVKGLISTRRVSDNAVLVCTRLLDRRGED
jgi:hypothetical protein